MGVPDTKLPNDLEIPLWPVFKKNRVKTKGCPTGIKFEKLYFVSIRVSFKHLKKVHFFTKKGVPLNKGP